MDTRTVILIGAMFLGGLATVYGALMLVAPKKWRRLLLPEEARDLRAGALSIRIAGLIFMAVGMFFVATVVRGLMKLASEAARRPELQPVVATSGTSDIHGLILGLLLIVLGSWTIWSPKRFFKIFTKGNYPNSAATLLLSRAMGIMMLIAGLFSLRTWWLH